MCLERAGRKFPFELQQFRAGLRDIDVDGVELLHGGERGVLFRLHQRPFCDRRLSDAARDRRLDACVAEHHPGRSERGAARLDVGLRLTQACHCVVVVLRAHDAGLDEFSGPLSPQLRRLQGRFGAGDGSFRHAVVRSIGRVVQLEEGLAGLDAGAFGEEPGLHDAAHLRADLGDQECAGASREFADQGDRFGTQGDDGDGHGSGALLGGLLLLPAADKGGRESGGQQDGADARCAVGHAGLDSRGQGGGMAARPRVVAGTGEHPCRPGACCQSGGGGCRSGWRRS